MSHLRPRFRPTFLLCAALALACDRSPADRDADATATASVAESVLANRAAALGLPAGVTLRDAAAGGRLYAATCIACHGPAGEGTQLGPALGDSVWLDADGGFAGVAGVIRSGVAKPVEFPVPMPPLGGGIYDETQVRALAAYVLTLKEVR